MRYNCIIGTGAMALTIGYTKMHCKFGTDFRKVLTEISRGGVNCTLMGINCFVLRLLFEALGYTLMTTGLGWGITRRNVTLGH